MPFLTLKNQIVSLFTMSKKSRPSVIERDSFAVNRQCPIRITPVFFQMRSVEVRAEHTFSRHRHERYEVILVDRGTYLASLNGKRLRLGRAEGLVVKPGDWHEDFCRPPLRYFGLAFHFDPVMSDLEAPNLFTDGVQPELQRFKADGMEFRPIVRRLELAAISKETFARQVQDALFAEFFWRMVGALPRSAISERFLDISGGQKFSAQLTQVIHESISSNPDVAELAGRMHMSVSSLAHKCRTILGKSPRQLLVAHKMARARALLLNTSMPVKEIATAVGFSDPYHFSKTFRKLIGSSPMAMRGNRTPQR